VIPGVVALGIPRLVAPTLVTIVVRNLRNHRIAGVCKARLLTGPMLAHSTSLPPGARECFDEGGNRYRTEVVVMAEQSKITEKAAELAGQAAAAAGPLASQAKEKATELAGTAAAAAGPMAAQAKEKAAELAEKAGELGAKGVSALAESIDKATGGKYSAKISSVTSKIEDKLDPDAPKTGGTTGGGTTGS
jgi:hypothetical protein